MILLFEKLHLLPLQQRMRSLAVEETEADHLAEMISERTKVGSMLGYEEDELSMR